MWGHMFLALWVVLITMVSWICCTGCWTDLPGKPRRQFRVAWEHLVEASVWDKLSSRLATDMFKSSIAETAASSCSQKAVSACHVNNHMTCWWTPLKKEALKLKKKAFWVIHMKDTPVGGVEESVWPWSYAEQVMGNVALYWGYVEWWTMSLLQETITEIAGVLESISVAKLTLWWMEMLIAARHLQCCMKIWGMPMNCQNGMLVPVSWGPEGVFQLWGIASLSLSGKVCANILPLKLGLKTNSVVSWTNSSLTQLRERSWVIANPIYNICVRWIWGRHMFICSYI